MTSDDATVGSRPVPATVMVAAFKGWNDAADAASDAVAQLRASWDTREVTALDPEPYHDFQVTRPEVSRGSDGVRRVAWPTTRVLETVVGGRRLLLVEGIEPSMRWRSYAHELLAVARREGVEMLVTLGALLTDVPHSRPIPVSATAEHAEAAERYGLEPSTYEGPTGIVGVLQAEALDAGLPGVSLWAAVPHYVAQPPNPKATLALLTRLEDVLGVGMPFGDLAEDAEAWQRGVDELAQEDTEIAEYVRQLEEAKDTADLPEASGEAIAREFERYLRRRQPPPG
jgi:proteasome assembly chaperone (PAC2) family protein